MVQVGLELIQDAGPSIPSGGQQVLHRAGAGEAAHRLLRQAQLPHDGLDPFALRAQSLHRRIALPGPDSQGGGLPTGERGLLGELPGVRWGIRLGGWAVPGRAVGRLGPAAAVAGHRLLRVFGEVVPQMPPVCDLRRLRCAGGRALGVGAGPVPAHHPHAGMLAQPPGERVGVPVGEQVHRPVGVHVDQHRAVHLPAAQREVVQ